MFGRFDDFLNQLTETNSTLDFFTDFEKIRTQVSAISIKLNQLNYLLGKPDLKQAVRELFAENKKCFDILGILIAVRGNRKVISDNGEIVGLNSYFESPEKVCEYLYGTGLAEVFQNGKIKNLVDYVFGIEVGLDTNARKNRSGTQMEGVVSRSFERAGICFKTQLDVKEFDCIKSLGSDVKVFDFVIKTKSNTYLIEVNYYNGGGSKLNEVARSYTDIAAKISRHEGYEFVWITDGCGWLSAKNKLQEAFGVIQSVYNLATLPIFIDRVLNEGVERGW